MPTNEFFDLHEAYMAVFDANVPLDGASNLIFYPPDYDTDTNTWGGRPIDQYDPTPEQIVAGRWLPAGPAKTPNQALQQTAGACRLFWDFIAHSAPAAAELWSTMMPLQGQRPVNDIFGFHFPILDLILRVVRRRSSRNRFRVSSTIRGHGIIDDRLPAARITHAHSGTRLRYEHGHTDHRVSAAVDTASR